MKVEVKKWPGIVKELAVVQDRWPDWPDGVARFYSGEQKFKHQNINRCERNCKLILYNGTIMKCHAIELRLFLWHYGRNKHNSFFCGEVMP